MREACPSSNSDGNQNSIQKVLPTIDTKMGLPFDAGLPFIAVLGLVHNRHSSLIFFTLSGSETAASTRLGENNGLPRQLQC